MNGFCLFDEKSIHWNLSLTLSINGQFNLIKSGISVATNKAEQNNFRKLQKLPEMKIRGDISVIALALFCGAAVSQNAGEGPRHRYRAQQVGADVDERVDERATGSSSSSSSWPSSETLWYGWKRISLFFALLGLGIFFLQDPFSVTVIK